MRAHCTLILLAVLSAVNSENSTLEDTCEPVWDGSFGALLEDWATEPASPRQGRIMALPSTKGYYVTERIDSPLVPPPPPHPVAGSGPSRPIPLQSPQHYGSAPPQGYNGPHGYNEWDAPGNGKIVNKPPSPYKDKFRPSYAQGGTRPQPANSIDRVDEPPRKQVTETDLYLLSAIEKLVYRADLMEKRLRKLEESLHYVVAGAEAKPEPCMANYTRVGSGCYQWSREAADWKGASLACRRQRAALLELAPPDRRALLAHTLADRQLSGEDFWTGGLNPGLLWIWSHSARPVEAARNDTAIPGEGRCLALAHSAAGGYALRGRDCAHRLRYVCQKEEDKTTLSNEIEKSARSLRLDGARKAKLLWDRADD
ncbi:uncharacterized protein LOC119829917 [Zerene cesonia]|uniref:uncharacterized protein LOC119829917 n=1 Tax=Zerene cesonia TaxID=33412 RepID=UPI0018E4F8CB|nr:uncharacterized protein LOC119829917 [Zerene cesonia]XP_038208574.1 uncharacterized protein LOC119829917 [Zerene cesonia]